VLVDRSGAVIAETETAEDGTYSLPAEPGKTYSVEPQKMAGFLRAPSAVSVSVPSGAGLVGPEADFVYDTGIR
jgi:hypothetical protein